MPGFDGTGPLGLGPFTGGGRGYCAVPVVPPPKPATPPYWSALPAYQAFFAGLWPLAAWYWGYRRPRLGLGFRHGWGRPWAVGRGRWW
ncbi:MAG TPA: DUF5320 domain-containing protein [Clostridia bacterium]|nr:DUF5320 domain-containing protein [Clostridia bacterium]